MGYRKAGATSVGVRGYGHARCWGTGIDVAREFRLG
jgi:hypothetical protein